MDSQPQNEELTSIEELGEFGFIEKITKPFQLNHASTIFGSGDDAAVINSGDRLLLFSTDMYLEGVHFDMMYTPLLHLGFKCISATVSDIYAMNGIASQVVVSLGMSSRFTVEAIEELYKGINHACHHFNVDMVGGDTTSSRMGLCINIAAVGFAQPESVVYRKGAKPGDIIVVTGDLGGAYVGLQILEREKRIYLEHPDVQPELQGNDYVLKRQLRPEARKDIIELLHDLRIKPTAMIDISDGLASEIMHICKESGTGCRLIEDNIPFDPSTYDTALKLNLDATLCALSGGEDYELLMTVSPSDYEKMKSLPDFTKVGEILPASEGQTLLTKSGNSHPLQAQGWKHF